LLFIVILAAEFIVQYFIIYVGGLGSIGATVAKLFVTTTIPFSMMLTSIGFGVGSLLVAVILKATPEHMIEKFTKFELDETGSLEGTDIISKTVIKIQDSLKRGDTEKLLDDSN